ncbi:MAG: hypothetical protein V4812_04435 [Pseudomonadota bacterium]
MSYTVTLRPVKPWSLRQGLLGSVLLAGLCACTNAQPLHADMASAVASQAFHALRSTAGHFAGGVWNEDVDRWNGKKHRAMEALLEQVRQGDYQSSQLIGLMGQPDRIWPESSGQYSQMLQQTQWQGVAQGELWAYHWRGEHDQLLFALQQGRVTASGWLLSGE